ncbi:MAG TPA: ribonuclease H-like domain-containing protein [Thermoplasmata archaeon]|nr:ribonuclease H-like domain-containing protein [Thermoplasmata archaeon]
MLRSTFCHLTGVGPVSENALWRSGCRDWDDLLAGGGPPGVSADRRRLWRAELDRSEEAVTARDPGFFARRLPSGESWRIAPEFAREIAYLDIETTGLSPYEGIVTVVAVHGGGATRSFVADDDLEELPAYLRRFPVLCTFNGRTFDVPFLQARFPEMTFPETHLDLRYILYRLGHAGGLKRIEERLGVARAGELKGVDGLEAVRLWHAHRAGRSGALERLIEYNRADTVNLEPLLAYAARELTHRTLDGMFPRPARALPI